MTLTFLTRTGWLLLAAFVTTSTPSMVAAETHGVTLRGVYDYSVFAGSSNALWSSTQLFSVQIKDCSWLIEHVDMAAATNLALVNVGTIASCDGANIYTVCSQSKAADELAWGTKYRSVSNQLPEGLISIFPGSYPSPVDPVVQHIWLALASSCTLRGEHGTAKPLLPVDLAVFTDTQFQCRYTWFTNLPGTPSRALLFTSDGRILTRGPKGSVLRSPLPPPFDKGYTNAWVDWRQTTNFNGILVPVDVAYTSFAPGPASHLIVGYKYRCIVTNISECESLAIPPPLTGGKFLVTDRRFQNKGYASLNYAVTNRWLAENDPLILTLLQHSDKLTLESEVQRAIFTPRTGTLGLRGVILLFLLLLPFGVLLLVRHRRKTKNQVE